MTGFTERWHKPHRKPGFLFKTARTFGRVMLMTSPPLIFEEPDTDDPTPQDDGPRPSSFSLDPVEKTDENPLQRPLERNYVFRKHLDASQKIDHWLRTRCKDEALKERVLACGSDAWVDRSPSTGRFRIRCTRCNWRACPICRVRWALKNRDKINSCVADVEKSRRKLATLTLRSGNAPLAQQVKFLWQSYTKLRHSKLWKSVVTGAIAVLEVTYNEKKDQWHPHLHVVLDSAFLEQKALSKSWAKITHGSKIVDIRQVRSFDSMAQYLSKYLMKAPTLPDSAPETRLDELFGIYSKSRFVRFQGTLRPRKGEEIWRPDYPEDWEPVTTLHLVLERAASGDLESQRMLDLIAAERILSADRDNFDAFPP